MRALVTGVSGFVGGHLAEHLVAEGDQVVGISAMGRWPAEVTQHYLADGTDVVIVRPFNHAGPRQSPRYVLAALAAQVAEVEAGRKDAIAVGNLNVVRDFTDVRDVVRAYRLLAAHGQPGEIY